MTTQISTAQRTRSKVRLFASKQLSFTGTDLLFRLREPASVLKPAFSDRRLFRGHAE